MSSETRRESEAYLSEQLITYIGNKRALLDFIGTGVDKAKARLGKKRLSFFDAFSGSGVVSRYFKAHAESLVANDLELYAKTINACYLANRSKIQIADIEAAHKRVVEKLSLIEREGAWRDGFIAELYAPKRDDRIRAGERVFFTARNARYIDTARQLIEEEAPEDIRHFLIAPLLAEASVHTNTSGVFKGFYKNSSTGIGKFGGKNGDALSRIKGPIGLPLPLFSDFECETRILSRDANEAKDSIGEVDLAYLDPPYNQHPYGSNYFMLNLIDSYKRPGAISPISGIPSNWSRSNYNKGRLALASLEELAKGLCAKFLLISFNSEGFISMSEMSNMLSRIGKTEVLEADYNAFRGSRNLKNRPIHVKEFLYLVEKK